MLERTNYIVKKKKEGKKTLIIYNQKSDGSPATKACSSSKISRHRYKLNKCPGECKGPG